jgi:hypothetical protein
LRCYSGQSFETLEASILGPSDFAPKLALLRDNRNELQWIYDPDTERAERFDIAALFSALDTQRLDQALSWPGVAKEIWNQSATLNAHRNDHPISATTLTGMPKRMDTSCQHALFMLRWLGRTPESFIPGSPLDAKSSALPQVGSDRRLRWDLQKLYNSLDAQRRERDLSWPQVARELRCTPNQLSGIKRARFAISMRLAMRIATWLDCPARDFVYAANW